MDLRKLIPVLICAIAGVIYIKKHVINKEPDVREPSKVEIAAEAMGRAAKNGSLKIKSEETTSAPAAATSASVIGAPTATDANLGPEERAKGRVKELMNAWKEGGVSLNESALAAACLWSRGVRLIPNLDEISTAATGYDAWRKEQNLYTDLTGYEVMAMTTRHNDPGRGGDYTIVQVVINSSVYFIGVPDGPNPLFWSKTF